MELSRPFDRGFSVKKIKGVKELSAYEQFLEVIKYCSELYQANGPSKAKRPLGNAMVSLWVLADITDSQIGSYNPEKKEWHSLMASLTELADRIIADDNLSWPIEALSKCLIEIAEDFWGFDISVCMQEVLENE